MSSCTAPPAQDVSRVADPDLATLVEIVGSQRLIEPRITGGFSFGAWQPQRRAPNADWRLVAIAGRVRHQRPGSDLDAVITLLGGDHDAAIRLLERPGDNPARAPHRLSDLAAARLARWRSEGRAFDAVRALDDVGRAIALRPDLDEAWFNRALALEAVGLSRSARRAWRQYVQRHPQSPWAAEARQRADADDEQATDGAARDPRQQLTQLIEAGDWPGVSRLVQRFPQHAREYLEDRLFAEQASGSDHSQLVDTVGRLGRLLHERHHESQWRLIGEELRGLTVTDRSRLATTLIDLQKARKAIDANQFDRAAQLLEPLPNRLPDAPGLSATARFWRVYVRWHRADRAAVLAEIAALQKEFARRHLKYLGARLSLMQAASLESLVRYSAAGDAFATAIRAFTTLGEDEFGASAEAMLANLLAIQGDLPGAWEHQRLALTALDRITSARRQVVVLANAVVLSTRHPVRYAALELQEELIAAARAWGDAGAVTRYHIERARLLNGLTRTADANGALQAARASLEAIADASNRRLFELDLQIEEARALIEPSPERAAALLADAIRRMPAAAGEARLAEAYLDLGRARQRAGRGEEALADWVSGIDLFERHRSQVQGEQLRISFFSRAWELYTEAVSEAVRQQQHDKALALVERSRARTLRDALGKPSSPLAGDGVSPFQRPANGTVIVEFASVRDAVLAWCITARGRTFARLSWSSTEFERQIQLVRDELLNGGGTDRTRQLSSVLLGSCANDLRASSHLIVIPDGVISSVPFASLTFPDDHEPLLERLTVTLAPSLSLIQSAPSATAQALAAPGSAVFLGDPAFDARSYPGLPRLADARREVHDSAEIYPSPVVLSGAQATAVALKRSIGTADVVHFAGHAVGDDEFPFRAVLLLAPADGDPGTLRADDLSGLRAGRTRLVILSGCSTATGSAAFGEGVLSLARPFLAAGVPSVLGTLWDLDDRAAAALLPRFHRGIREGLRPAEALRRAQLSLLHGNDEGLRSPRAWAGFVLIGGA